MNTKVIKLGGLSFITGAVRIVADVNNALLPLWLVALGISFIRITRTVAR